VIGLVAVTASGRAAAEQLAAAWPDSRLYPGPASRALPRAFAECDQVVCFLAVGATVRLIAPLLGTRGRAGAGPAKATDPGVVCVDEARAFAVPVAGAHAGGANALAERIAGTLGSAPVITTASDAAGVAALDEFGADLGFAVDAGSDLAEVGAAVLGGARVTLTMDQTWPVPPLPGSVVRTDAPESGVPAIVVTDMVTGRAARLRSPRVLYRPPSLVAGVGASAGAPAGEISRLVDETLAGAGLSAASVHQIATIDVKSREPGLVGTAAERGWQIATYPAADLAAVPVPNPSDAVRSAVGTPSVAEAAALAAAGVGAELAAAKRKSAHATAAVARRRARGRLALVGIGPGARDLMTPRATAELRRASVVVGLDQYIRQVHELLCPGTRVLASGLGAEQERARAAAEEARAGHAVALVGSGDAGIYAMAGPALEYADGSFDVAGVPGVSAALAAAAVLGAPLGHDHACISLSDLHTPWDVIERRIIAAAEGDFAVCFYNPRSAARSNHLARALALLAKHRPPGTPVGMVADASRPGQRALLSTLADFDPAQADMHTLVIVGSSRTRVTAGRMITPRGYRWAET
jgi:cobalt-precorrin 5A hydrolase / precorrin-3B C17-methyltransferase